MNFDQNSEKARLAVKQLTTEEIFNGVILHVVRDQVGLSNGNTTVREVIRHIGAVCVIPVTENNEVVVERQYRYPLDRVILEIPAGKLDAPDEDRLSAAQRELMEETGYTADEWTEIGDFHPAPAYSDEYITMYLARGLHKRRRVPRRLYRPTEGSGGRRHGRQDLRRQDPGRHPQSRKDIEYLRRTPR